MNRLKQLAYAGFALVPAGQPLPGQQVTLSVTADLVQRIAQFLIIIGMVIAVIMIVYGGIRWMVSPDDSKAAKAIVVNGLIGAAIVLGVGVLLQTLGGIVTFQAFN